MASAVKVLRHFFQSDTGIALLIAITFQFMLSVIGSVYFPGPGGAPLHHTMQWDAAWYTTIITDHYVHNAASPVFYPLFPLIIGVLSALTFGLIPYAVLGLALNTLCLWLAIVALLSIARHFSVRLRWFSVVFLLASPAAFFLHFFYTESLFIAIGFWAYAFALKRNWRAVGFLLAALTACRLPALLFIGLCGLEYLRAYNWDIRKSLNRNALYFALAPVGFFLYYAYLGVVRGDFLASFHAYNATDDWLYQQFNPNFLHTIARAANETLKAFLGERPFNTDILINHAVPLLCIAILFTASLYLLLRHDKKGVPLGVFGLVSIIFFTLNSNIVSVHRYTLPCLTIYVALMLLLTKKSLIVTAIVMFIGLFMIALQILLINVFLSLHLFVG